MFNEEDIVYRKERLVVLKKVKNKTRYYKGTYDNCYLKIRNIISISKKEKDFLCN